MSECMLVWEEDCGSQALYDPNGKLLVVEYCGHVNAHQAECDSVTFRKADITHAALWVGSGEDAVIEFPEQLSEDWLEKDVLANCPCRGDCDGSCQVAEDRMFARFDADTEAMLR